MTFPLVKFILTSLLVVLVSESSKKSSFVGGLLASLPLVSFLSFIWLYWETKDAGRVAALSISIFWLVLPSLVLFPLLWFFIKREWNFWLSLTSATGVMIGLYFFMILVAKRMGFQL